MEQERTEDLKRITDLFKQVDVEGKEGTIE
jgi:hypothetical protein